MPLSREHLERYERTGWRAPVSMWADLLSEHHLTRRLPAGQHIAPYLSLTGGPLRLHIARGGLLVDVTALDAADSPSPDDLLPRGVHLAPWRDQGGMPAYIAVDAAHRCVAWTVHDGGSLISIVRDLLLILDAHECGGAENAVRHASESVAGWSDEDDEDDDDEDDDDAGEEWKRSR